MFAREEENCRKCLSEGDIVGKRTILGPAFSLGRESGKITWAHVCECVCGSIDVIRAKDLYWARSHDLDQGCKECGFLTIGEKNATHGLTKFGAYRNWADMMKRCYNQECKDYESYGKVGVTVFESWHDPKVFISWALENCWRPKLQLHRLDSRFGYFPSNCIFVTASEHGKITRTETRAA